MGSDTQKPYKINQISYKLEKIKNQRKPKQYLSEEEGLKYSGIIHPYMYKRGFTNKVIKLYELGYDSETNSIVFPVRDSEGNIRFLQRRSITGKYFLNDKGVDKRDVLYGLYYILKSGVKLKEVTIVESATDVISCYLNGLAAVALMGRYLYDEMIPQLLRLRTRSVNLFLDNDKAGIEATKGIAEKLYGYGFNVRKCDWSINFKDANEVHLARSMDSVHFEPAFKALR
jgi:DNA primase